MVSAKMEARIRQQWKTTKGDNRKMARFLGLNQRFVVKSPPVNLEDLLDRFDRGYYTDFSAGASADGGLQVCVARGLSEAIHDVFRHKYGTNVSAERLFDVITTKCPDILTQGASLVGVVDIWNSTNKDGTGTSIIADVGRGTVYHTKLTAFVTDDFSVAVQAVQRLNNDVGGSSCAVGVVTTPEGTFHALTAQTAGDGKISAIDLKASGSAALIEPDNFVELVVYDIVATDRAGVELSKPNPSYGCVLAWLQSHCWVNRQNGGGLLDDDDVSTSPGGSDESCDENFDDICAEDTSFAEIQKLLQTADFDMIDAQHAAKILSDCLQSSLDMNDNSCSQQLTAALMVNKSITEKLPEVLQAHERTLRALGVPDLDTRVKELHSIGKKLQRFCRTCLKLYPHIKDTVTKMKAALLAFEDLKYYSQLADCSHEVLRDQTMLTVKCLEDAQVSKQMFADFEKLAEISQQISKHCEKEMKALQQFHDETKAQHKRDFVAEKDARLQQAACRDEAARETLRKRQEELESASDNVWRYKAVGKGLLGLAIVAGVVGLAATWWLGPVVMGMKITAAGASASAFAVEAANTVFTCSAVAGAVCGAIAAGETAKDGGELVVGAAVGSVAAPTAVAVAGAAAALAVVAAVPIAGCHYYGESCKMAEAEEALPGLTQARAETAAAREIAQADADHADALFDQASKTAEMLRSIQALAESYGTVKRDMEHASCLTDMLRNFLKFFMDESSEKYGALQRRLDRPAPDDRSRSLGIVAIVARLLPDETIDRWHERLRDLDGRNEELLTLSCHAWDSFSSTPSR